MLKENKSIKAEEIYRRHHRLKVAINSTIDLPIFLPLSI